MVEGWKVPCHACRADIDIGDGWSVLSSIVQCPSCQARNSIVVDEDAGCNYWFEADAPEAA